MGFRVKAEISYLKKVFFFTHLMGLLAAVLFPFIASLMVGEAALQAPFILLCIFFGYGLAVSSFLFVRSSLKKQLRQQLIMLMPLTGEIQISDESIESLSRALEKGVLQTQSLVEKMLSTADQLIPYYRSLGEASYYLVDRAKDGLLASKATRKDVEVMELKQSDVQAMMQQLSHRTQDEAALSRQLSASLEEMAMAMDHSTVKFLETTTAVEEMTASVREVANQADEITRSVEGTAQSLDIIGESFEKIRKGAALSNESVQQVKTDAENGLAMMKQSMQETEQIVAESAQATTAMERLSKQAQQVSKIIGVIKNLVSDTELLAFNAAIIAAKAGDEGKSFAVVAEEIKDLADRTTSSAQDIQQIIQAIRQDTDVALGAVETTAERIAQGRVLALNTDSALQKIVSSVVLASSATDEINRLTISQGSEAQNLLKDAVTSLRSVRAVARAVKEQRTGISRIQDGVTEMKSAADQVTRGMEEQVRATRELDRGLAEREEQVVVMNEANRFQQQAAQRLISHFNAAETRLGKNLSRASAISDEIAELEKLTSQLHKMGSSLKLNIDN
ncbi:methyl-accepting chemotaxis protein [Geopsychrobacter electrodiphilus]|uniref:methyl-accepting chemotaxis protein n=1 Tax=Geopsychrobacter electrodiphilus TaxID=225196 RepID=UPI000381EBDB|nr:methyl-accepting chemotaxis protein [Geopsychrobacter electrodiphilus]